MHPTPRSSSTCAAGLASKEKQKAGAGASTNEHHSFLTEQAEAQSGPSSILKHFAIPYFRHPNMQLNI